MEIQSPDQNAGDQTSSICKRAICPLDAKQLRVRIYAAIAKYFK